MLDDCSVDESICILNDYLNKYRDKTIAYFNKENSGGVFHQWRKGLAAATGELVWIAESDDFCSENFLEELVRFFVNPAVMLAFARTEFIQEDGVKTIWTQEEYLERDQTDRRLRRSEKTEDNNQEHGENKKAGLNPRVKLSNRGNLNHLQPVHRLIDQPTGNRE